MSLADQIWFVWFSIHKFEGDSFIYVSSCLVFVILESWVICWFTLNFMEKKLCFFSTIPNSLGKHSYRSSIVVWKHASIMIGEESPGQEMVEDVLYWNS